MNAILLSLLVALRAVESSNGTDISNGKGDYQIESICVADVNRVYGTHYRYPRDVQNRKRAEEIAILYMAYWGPRVEKNPTAETFARVFHRGPKNWNDAKGAKYWEKVRRAIKTSNLPTSRPPL